MMRFIGIVLLFHLSLASHAQVVNSLSKNQNGFYTHALDSVISIIKKEKTLHTVLIVGKECTKQYLPDSLQGVAIKWKAKPARKNQNDKLKEDEAMVMIECLSIIRDEVTVAVYTPRQGDQLYVFRYYYQPDTRDYKLKSVKTGMTL